MPGSEWRFRAFGLAQRRPPQERQSERRCTAKLFWTCVLLRYEVQQYGLADADLPAVPLPTVRLPLYHHTSRGTIGVQWGGPLRCCYLPSPFGRLGSRQGFRRSFWSGRQGLPNWDCAAEAHFKRGED